MNPMLHRNMITPVILCGGSGTRLWPLSRQSFPKQFVPLVGNKSLLQLTLDRLAWCDNPVICVAAEDHRFLVADAIEAENVPGQVLLEPAARNTAAAMALAALLARAANNADPLLLFCPSDHHIPDAAAFAKTIREGVPAAEAGAIVTFGVVPSFPSSAYGYIQQGDERTDGSRQVARFIEKPAPAAAQAQLASFDGTMAADKAATSACNAASASLPRQLTRTSSPSPIPSPIKPIKLSHEADLSPKCSCAWLLNPWAVLRINAAGRACKPPRCVMRTLALTSVSELSTAV